MIQKRFGNLNLPQRATHSETPSSRLLILQRLELPTSAETTILWDRTTGKPVANAIVWQSRITAPFCEKHRAAGHESVIREKAGLVLDAYFSATKIEYLLDTIPGFACES